jgi:hypothetical protein
MSVATKFLIPYLLPYIPSVHTIKVSALLFFTNQVANAIWDELMIEVQP